MPLPETQNAPLTGDFDKKTALIRAAIHFQRSEDAMERTFTLMGKRAALYFVDGLVDHNQIYHFILEPCIRAEGDDPTLELLINRILPGGGVRETTRLPALTASLYGGDAALIVEDLPGALLFDVKGYCKRGVDKAANEAVVQGPQEAFTESLRDNIVLLRRIMRTPQLISEEQTVGTRIKARLCLLYLDGVAEEKTVNEVRRRLAGVNVDYVSSIGMLEQLIEDHPFALVPQCIATERPDRAASFLLAGEVLICMENAPQMLAVPISILQLFHAPDDISLRFEYGLFLRLLRLTGIVLSLFVPAFFVALTGFHTEGMPLSLLTSALEAQSRMPIAVFPAVMGMLVVFSLINEACTRVPPVMGGSLGVVSALILGQAVADADLVSPLLIVIVALSGLGSFVLPDYPLSIALRIAQMLLVLSAGLAGYFGMVLCFFVLLSRTLSLRSLSSPLCAPFAPERCANPDKVLRYPIWRLRLRGYMSNPYSMRRARGRMRGWEDQE